MKHTILVLCAIMLLVAVSQIQAEPQDVPQATESERAGLVKEEKLLELLLNIARKKDELQRLNKSNKPADGNTDVLNEKEIILVGVRGQDHRLTAVFQGMPLPLRVGDQVGNYTLRNLTPNCATFVNVDGSVEMKRCLNTVDKKRTVLQQQNAPKTIIPPSQAMLGGQPMQGASDSVVVTPSQESLGGN